MTDSLGWMPLIVIILSLIAGIVMGIDVAAHRKRMLKRYLEREDDV